MNLEYVIGPGLLYIREGGECVCCISVETGKPKRMEKLGEILVAKLKLATETAQRWMWIDLAWTIDELKSIFRSWNP